MISQQQIEKTLEGYDKTNIAIGTLGGHSALDVCRGAKMHGFRTVVVCQKGREKTYSKFFRSRNGKGVVDEIILVDSFKDIAKKEIQEQLRKLNTIFVHNRYFWVYCNYAEIENKFNVPLFGTRDMVKLEERDIAHNQYFLLQKAGIRIPHIFKSPQQIDRMAIVKVPEAKRAYERAFFLCNSYETFREKSMDLLKRKVITDVALRKAVIEEYAIGAHVNFNFFYSAIDDELELMGTDTRRQTNLDGFLRLPCDDQMEALKLMRPKMIETGHCAVTIKESLLEKVLDLGERFVRTTQKLHKPGILGPFALQGAIVAEEGKEDIVIFDVSMRIPGSPGTMFTPYSGYLHRQPLSFGERIAMEVKKAIETDQLEKICT